MSSDDSGSNQPSNKGWRNLLFMLIALAGILYGLATL